MADAEHSVMLALPGQSFMWVAVQGVITASLKNRSVKVFNSAVGWDDLNRVWIEALNAHDQGAVTHFAMLHSDIGPEPGWLDTLIEELERLDADLISVPAPIKDHRGVTSSGIGDPRTRWHPYRRFTVKELDAFPETYSAADVGYPGGILLHNTGCWACDLRKDVFRTTDENGYLKLVFNFPIGGAKAPDGKWINLRESEDWYFSRELHILGGKSYQTRKVKLYHFSGGDGYPNHGKPVWGEWGYQNGDEETAPKWGQWRDTQGQETKGAAEPRTERPASVPPPKASVVEETTKNGQPAAAQ